MDNFDFKKYLTEGRLHHPLNLQEGKGQDLADKYVAKLRQEFKNLSDDELDEFKKTIAQSLDLNESVDEGFLGHPSERESKRDFKKQFPKFRGSSSQGQDFGHPDNIISVVDDMTLTMGEDAFIAAVFKALPLEDAKRILRDITKDNPISNELGPVTYDWLKENDPFFKSDSTKEFLGKKPGPSSQFVFEPNDEIKDIEIHTVVDEYQEKIFDYLWNYELYKNEYLKESVNESTKSYGDALKNIAKDKQLKMLSKKDKETLLKIADLIKGEKGESINEDGDYFDTPTLANKATLHKGLKRQIQDIEDSLESGESDGEPLTNETEMLLQQELTKLKKKLRNFGGVN